MTSFSQSLLPPRLNATPEPHWPALDGLRVLAVIAVMLYHAGPGVAVNGYLGVDVFFVLSGLLITSLLLHERSLTGRVSLRDFYVRRLLRLYPALVVVVLGVVAVALVTGQQVAAVGQGAVVTLFYVANVWIYTGHETVLLQHSWTLALEEQFYLVWPPVFVLLVALRPQARRTSVLLLIALAVVLALLPLQGDAAAVRGSYLRATGLVYGCALAVLHRRGVGAPGILAATCGALLAFLAFGPLHAPESFFTSGLDVAALLTLPVVLHLTRPDQRGMLTARPARWVGRRSYGLYLWHFPVLRLTVHQSPVSLPHWLLTAAGLALSCGMAALSYRFVEEPFLRRKVRFEVMKPAPGLPVTAEPERTATGGAYGGPTCSRPAS